MLRALRSLWHQYRTHGDAELALLKRRTAELKAEVDALRAAAAARRAAEEAVVIRELRSARDAVTAAAAAVDEVAGGELTKQLGAASARADAGLDDLARGRAAAVVAERGSVEDVFRAVVGGAGGGGGGKGGADDEKDRGQ